jgi:hypothetical protein
MLPIVIGGLGGCLGAISAEISRGERWRNRFPCTEQDERDDERKHRIPD